LDGEKEMKKNKLILTVSGVLLIVIALSVVLIKAVPTASNRLTSSTTSNGKNTAVSYNVLDSAAILGAFAIARQVPATKGKALDTFIASLAAAKAGIGKVDLGVFNNTLVDYIVDPTAGVNAPVCFVVKPPVVNSATPGQAQWVLYFEPPVGKKVSLVIMVKSITTCADAIKLAGTLSDGDRRKISDASRALAKSAILNVPASALSKTGLYLLDEARGLISGNASATATSTATPTPSTTPTKGTPKKVKGK